MGLDDPPLSLPSDLRHRIDAGFALADALRYPELSLDAAVTWRAAGFDCAAAHELLDADPELSTDEARLWRARAHAPAEVRPGQRYPLHLFPEPGNYSSDDLDRIPDPPGTRGASAARRRARDW